MPHLPPPPCVSNLHARSEPARACAAPLATILRAQPVCPTPRAPFTVVVFSLPSLSELRLGPSLPPSLRWSQGGLAVANSAASQSEFPFLGSHFQLHRRFIPCDRVDPACATLPKLHTPSRVHDSVHAQLACTDRNPHGLLESRKRA